MALEGSRELHSKLVGGICSHMTDEQPPVTSETRSANRSYPIM